MIYETQEQIVETDFPQILRPYFEDLSVGVFDIETTGLSPDRSAFILGGLGRAAHGVFPEGHIRVEQYFAESRREEDAALDRCLAALSGLDAVVTYNGERFDFPFVRRRAAEYGLDALYTLPHNLDLYRIINKFSPLRKFLPNLRQKTVENFCGLWQDRTDEIDGAESVALYERWERRGEPEVLRTILLHNSDDVAQLSRLLPVVRRADVHRAMTNLGFPVGSLSVTALRYEGARGGASDGGRIVIEGVQRGAPLSYFAYSDGEQTAEIAFDAHTASFSCAAHLRSAGRLLVLDLEKLLPECTEFSDSPFCESGFLAVRQDDAWQYAELNRFARLFLKKVLREMGVCGR